MRDYEFTVIFNSEEEKTEQGLATLTKLFETAGIEIAKQEDMGVRTLAYIIKKQEKGHYVYFEIKADPANLADLNTKLLLCEPVIKFLFVVK
ncbi:MAG: 30S ribosomal protein S6 [Sphaerochaetaceae bacterium]